jgi:hypothetical protein
MKTTRANSTVDDKRHRTTMRTTNTSTHRMTTKTGSTSTMKTTGSRSTRMANNKTICVCHKVSEPPRPQRRSQDLKRSTGVHLQHKYRSTFAEGVSVSTCLLPCCAVVYAQSSGLPLLVVDPSTPLCSLSRSEFCFG